MAIRIDGKAVSKDLREKMKGQVADFVEKYGFAPGLAVVLVGENPASQVYVRNKHLACQEVGIRSFVYTMPEDTTEEALLSLLKELNENKDVNGILVQLPLPKHLSEESVIQAISPDKDVDAFHYCNAGKILVGKYRYLPCTPAGVMALLDAYHIDVARKECVVVGRSNIVGKPQALLLLERNGTVTVCHSKTANLPEVTRRADVLVVAVGKAHFITADMVKEGATVIDVGINRLETGKLAGDVDFDAVEPIAGAITPVPGGVGPMTITMLLQNTIKAAEYAANNK